MMGLRCVNTQPLTSCRYQPMPKFKPLPAAEDLREMFDYKPLTGELIHTKARPGTKVGTVAGCKDTKGYLRIKVNGGVYQAHRLIWKWVTGEDPQETIDHHNRNKTDNAWHNLRPATGTQQAQNRKHRGTWINGKKWASQVQVNGIVHRLGVFDTEAEARAAYVEASKRLHGEFSSVY